MSYLAIEALLLILGVVITVANLVLLHRSIRTYQANRATLAANAAALQQLERLRRLIEEHTDISIEFDWERSR